MAGGFEMFVRLFRIKASKSLKKTLSRSYLQQETDTERALYNLRMPKLQEIFTTIAIVFHRGETRCFAKMFSPLFCFE